MRSTAEKEKDKNKDKAKAEESAAPAEEQKAPEAELPDEEPEIRRRPWTKERVRVMIFQLLIVIVVAGGIIFYCWHKNRNEQYKTGITEGGELCVAYSCPEGVAGAGFTLEGGAVGETARFAFSKFDGTTRTGRIYTPVSEGKATLFTEHSEKAGEVIYERFDITVDSGGNITFTVETLTEEQYAEEKEKA